MRPRTFSTVPTDTCPGMIGYGTPLSRPCHRWTSVPHTSENIVRSNMPPGSTFGSGNSRSSMGANGLGMTAAITDGMAK